MSVEPVSPGTPDYDRYFRNLLRSVAGSGRPNFSRATVLRHLAAPQGKVTLSRWWAEKRLHGADDLNLRLPLYGLNNLGERLLGNHWRRGVTPDAELAGTAYNFYPLDELPASGNPGVKWSFVGAAHLFRTPANAGKGRGSLWEVHDLDPRLPSQLSDPSLGFVTTSTRPSPAGKVTCVESVNLALKLVYGLTTPYNPVGSAQHASDVAALDSLAAVSPRVVATGGHHYLCVLLEGLGAVRSLEEALRGPNSVPLFNLKDPPVVAVTNLVVGKQGQLWYTSPGGSFVYPPCVTLETERRPSQRGSFVFPLGLTSEVERRAAVAYDRWGFVHPGLFCDSDDEDPYSAQSLGLVGLDLLHGSN